MLGKPKSAEVYIYSEIGQSPFNENACEAKKLIDEIKSLGELDELVVRINSPGGSVYEGTAIYNFLKGLKAKKLVKIDGVAASMASEIAMAGDVVTMPSNTLMMIHDPMIGTFGNADELRSIADFLDKIKEGSLSIYTAKSGQSREVVAQMMSAETWMTAAEAKELGFCDEVVDPVEITNSFDFSKFKNPPEMTAVSKEPDSEDDPEPENVDPENKEGDSPPMDKDELKNEHPDVYEAILVEGAKAERERIEAIDALSVDGEEELIEKMKADSSVTPEQAAIKILQAVKAKNEKLKADKLKGLQEDAPTPVNQSVPPSVNKIPDAKPKNLDDRLKAQWEADPSLQDEMDLDAYLCYEKARMADRI